MTSPALDANISASTVESGLPYMVSVITKHAWAMETFPEFDNEISERTFALQLATFIKQCGNSIVEQEAVSVLGMLLVILDNHKIRHEFMYDEIGLEASIPMNAALLCTLSFKIASIHLRSSRPEVDDFYHQKHNKIFKTNIDHDHFTDFEMELMSLAKNQYLPKLNTTNDDSTHDWIKPYALPTLKVRRASDTQAPLILSSSKPPKKKEANPNTFSGCALI